MARKRQETLVLFKDVLNITEKFSDAQFGALMRAAFDYRFEGEGYQGEDALVELAFRMLEAQIDRYREACETNTKNAQREEPMRPAAQEVPETIPQEAPGESCANEGERNAAESSEMQPNTPHNRTHNHTHNYNHTQTYNHAHYHTQDAGSEKPALAPFSPPSVEEVRAYAKENKIDFDSAKFVDFYSANDWRLGTAKMKDWKLAVRVWSAAPAMQT